jgi:hypothetical protein
LLGKRAPARDEIAADGRVLAMCHEPARERETDARRNGARRNGARRNGGESTKRDDFILWKSFCLSSDGHARTRQAVVVRAVVIRGFRRCAVKPHDRVMPLQVVARNIAKTK